MAAPFCQAYMTDPTKPLSYSANTSAKVIEKEELTLQTIVERENTKSVVISGQLLSVGDKIEQYELIKIENNSVVLSSPEKKLKLSLFSSVLTNKNEK